MALFGGVYLTCMIGLLPDKQLDTYERFFAMVSAYLDTNDLPNNFEGHFFMTDFERNIRSSFQLFWPSARLLGCYFHFSQVVNADLRMFIVLDNFDPHPDQNWGGMGSWLSSFSNFFISACMEKSEEVWIPECL